MMRDQCDALKLTPELKDAASQSKTWPFEEARKIIKRYEKAGYPDSVIFETGYGPSGLPHIGTFGEVARTTMVRHAFHILTENKVKQNCFVFLMIWMVCARFLRMCLIAKGWSIILVNR